MPTVQDVLDAKGARVHTIAPQATVLEAIHKMNQQKIEALVVMQSEQVVGMFTERDVLRRVAGEERNPGSTTVAEVMTDKVVCVEPHTDLNSVSEIMKDRRIRHLPVCDGGRLIGMVSIGDVNAEYATHQQAQIHYLNEYIYGRV